MTEEQTPPEEREGVFQSEQAQQMLGMNPPPEEEEAQDPLADINPDDLAEEAKTPEEKYVVMATDVGKTLAELAGEVLNRWEDKLDEEEVRMLDEYFMLGYMTLERPMGSKFRLEVQTPPAFIQRQSDRIMYVTAQGLLPIGQARAQNTALVAMYLSRYGEVHTSYPMTEAGLAKGQEDTEQQRRVVFESADGLRNRESFTATIDTHIVDQIGGVLRVLMARAVRLLTAGSIQNF